VTKAKISEYSATAGDNTDVNGVNIAEGCPPSSMNNMGREIMAALKRFQVGSDGDGVTVGGALVVSGATTLTTVSATVVQSDTVSEKTSAAGVTIDSVLLKDGTVKATTTIGVGNATPAASGAGITFPATQSASSDANTLDDYEEGTFTPTFNNLTVGNGTTWGRYTKIGNVVTVYCGFEFGSTSSFGGTMASIGGLPFQVPAYTPAGGGEAMVNAVGYILDRLNANYPMIGIATETGTSIVGILRTDTRAQINATSPMTWANEDTFSITMTYQV
jgi:hypothetical protein